MTMTSLKKSPNESTDINGHFNENREPILLRRFLFDPTHGITSISLLPKNEKEKTF